MINRIKITSFPTKTSVAGMIDLAALISSTDKNKKETVQKRTVSFFTGKLSVSN